MPVEPAPRRAAGGSSCLLATPIIQDCNGLKPLGAVGAH